jgi:hypothetical protein
VDNFSISYKWTRRDRPLPLDDARLQDSSLLWATLDRFLADYEGRFFIPTARDEIELWFDYDLLQIFDQLPVWLMKLATVPLTPVELLFPSQGTELKLIATRINDEISVRTVSLAGGSAFPSEIEPIVVSAGGFFREWKNFFTSVLDVLAQTEPALRFDEEFQRYYAALEKVSSNPEGS